MRQRELEKQFESMTVEEMTTACEKLQVVARRMIASGRHKLDADTAKAMRHLDSTLKRAHKQQGR